MKTAVAGLMAAALVAAACGAQAAAKPMKPKMVKIYQAEKCHMYFSSDQARHDHYVCPDSHGKMHMMMVSAAFAQKVLPRGSKTNGTM